MLHYYQTCMEKLEKEYLNIIRELISNIEDAIQFWTLFTNIKKIHLAKQYTKSFYLIQTIRNASSLAFMVQLAKLVDKKGVSINNTVTFLRKNPNLFEKKSEETTNLINKVSKILLNQEQIIKKIINQRNRYHVHTDKKDIKENPLKVFEEFNIKLNEIEPFLTDLIHCIGELNNHYRTEPHIPFYELQLDLDPTIKDFLHNRGNLLKRLNIEDLLIKLRD